MSRPLTLAESRLIAERVMGWQVTEQNGRLFIVDSAQRPAWQPTCAVPDWLNDPAAAAMALAELLESGEWNVCHCYDMLPRRHIVELEHRLSGAVFASNDSQDWPKAAIWAILAAVAQ